MKLGRINSLIFVTLILLLIFISAIQTSIWQDFRAEKVGVLIICVGGAIGLAFMNNCSYNNPVDGKHSIRMKVYLDDNGISCMNKKHLVWSCNWNEIHHLEKRCNIHRIRSIYIYLSNDEEKPFFFEYSLSAKRAFFETCPREDLVNQIR